LIETEKFLEENGYLFLPDFIDKDSCRLMAESMIQAVESGKSMKDPQCPLSHSFIDVFDEAHNELLPHLENVTGKKLIKTYNYCRLYQPGEVLERHTDRESCEYSITLTVGFEGESWPFFVEEKSGFEKEILASIGDMIVYKGIERPHWRNEYKEGEWQAQIFFHYVDAEGEYKNQPILEMFRKEKNVFVEQT
jgi:hypothetical protein